MSKRTARIPLLVLFLATATTNSYAGATISDRRYWPSEARQSVHELLVPQVGANSAFASLPVAPAYSFTRPAGPSRQALKYRRARNSR